MTTVVWLHQANIVLTEYWGQRGVMHSIYLERLQKKMSQYIFERMTMQIWKNENFAVKVCEISDIFLKIA